MIYFKKIDIDFYDEIVLKSLTFIKMYPEIFYRKKQGASLYNLPLFHYLKEVPEIHHSFKKLNLICTRAAAYVMYNNTHSRVHKDCNYPLSRINIPLLNCKNTYTEFYTNTETQSYINPETGIHSFTVINSDYSLADRVEIDKTTVIKVSEPHNVKMDETNSPRICLTLGFNRNPDFLLD